MTLPRTPDGSAVAAHYAELAAHYRAGENKACRRAYLELADKALAGFPRLLELGGGASPLLPELSAHSGLTCDLSVPMLLAQPHAGTPRIAADAQALAFRDAVFDGVFCVNLLEHVPEPGVVLNECARMLRPGGRLLAITPNGDLAVLLEWLERLRLKLPEGPHRFLPARELAQVLPPELRPVAHRRFLACPAGPPLLVRAIDSLLGGRTGLFQYLIAERA